MGLAYSVGEQLLEVLIIHKDIVLKWGKMEDYIPGLNKNYASVLIHKLRKEHVIETKKGYGVIYKGRKHESEHPTN